MKFACHNICAAISDIEVEAAYCPVLLAADQLNHLEWPFALCSSDAVTDRVILHQSSVAAVLLISFKILLLIIHRKRAYDRTDQEHSIVVFQYTDIQMSLPVTSGGYSLLFWTGRLRHR